MPLVEYNKLTAAQKQAVHEMYPDCFGGHYSRWAFWITRDGNHTRAKGRHSLTVAGYDAYMREHRTELAGMLGTGEPFSRPEKGDLSAWKPGVTFHFSRD